MGMSSLFLSVASGMFFGVFFSLPDFLFSCDIINFNCLFFLSATFLPAYRRTYKQYGRFRIRYDTIRQIVNISVCSRIPV